MCRDAASVANEGRDGIDKAGVDMFNEALGKAQALDVGALLSMCEFRDCPSKDRDRGIADVLGRPKPGRFSRLKFEGLKFSVSLPSTKDMRRWVGFPPTSVLFMSMQTLSESAILNGE